MGYLASGERRCSAEDVARRAAHAASGFASLGIGPGDSIAMCLRNDFAFFECSRAAGLVGAYPVAMNWHYTGDEAAWVLSDCRPSAIVIHADLLARLGSGIPSDVPVLVVPTPPEIEAAYRVPAAETVAAPGSTRWDEWVDRFEPLAAAKAEPPGVMLYTSGTTGRPKGVRRHPPSSEQVRAQEANRALGFGFIDAGPITTVVTGPMYHSGPYAYGQVALARGGDVILQPRFDAEELLRWIEEQRVTHLHMVPIMFNRLLKLPAAIRARYDLSSLAFVVHSAAPISPHVKREMMEWWGPIIHEYYGTTETSMLAYCTAEEWLSHPGTVGRALPGVDLRILDAAAETAGPREVGEVLGRSTTIADFTYHNDPDKRSAADRLGLFSSGDVGYLDEDGFLYICDRSKDLIISGGVNIYPAEIEAELHKMPGIADCAVFGVPDAEYGEAVHAVVSPAAGANLGGEAVRTFLRGRVAGFKLPRTVEVRSDLPREDSGKSFKRTLRDEHWKSAGRQV